MDSYQTALRISFIALALLRGVAASCAGDLPGVVSYPLPAPIHSSPGFTQVPASQTGITFSNIVTSFRSLHTLVASGVAAGDVDGDGLCDLYFCSQDGPNALYRNLGNWRFEDITESAGVACRGRLEAGQTGFSSTMGQAISRRI
jgi:hypothetical protein